MLRRVFLLLALLALVFEVALDGARAERCPEGNLLAEAKPVAVVAPVVNDGRLVPEGSRWDAHAAATRTGFGPLAIFDLGEPTRVRSGLIQADGNDTYLVSFSRDGKTFEPASGKRSVQASSVVKQSSGASQMVSRSKAASITVRAARRRRLSGASQ